jgi:DNA-binding CsgD family transcriptional regulator
MSPLVILVFLATALFTGPTAFLFIWLTYRKTGERTLRTLAFSLLGLCFILLGNTATFLLDNYLKVRDARIAFVLMNEVFLSTVMMCGFILLFAHEATGTTTTSAHRTIFWVFTVLFFFLVISLPIFLVSGSLVDVRRGYLAATIYGTICQTYATILFVFGRSTLPAIYRRTLPPIFLVFLALSMLSVLNDIIHFGPSLGGPDFPFSPFFFIVMNVLIVALCVKTLLTVEGPKQQTSAIPDFGFTEREQEIVPLIVEGFSNEAIAEKLFISPHTVKNHVTSIFRKANVANRFELLKRTKGIR